mgnify:CR=1 FL=1
MHVQSCPRYFTQRGSLKRSNVFSTVCSEKIYDEEFLLFANKDHRILKKKTISTSDIKLNKLWLLEDGYCLNDEIIKACHLRHDVSQLPGHLNVKIGILPRRIWNLLKYDCLPCQDLCAFCDPTACTRHGRLEKTFKDEMTRRLEKVCGAA